MSGEMSAAERRRELRRQKILANSGNRLDVVTGKKEITEIEKVEPQLPATTQPVQEDYPEDPPLERLVRSEYPEDPPLESLLLSRAGAGGAPPPGLEELLSMANVGNPAQSQAAKPAEPPFWLDTLPWLVLGLSGPLLTDLSLIGPNLVLVLILASLSVIFYRSVLTSSPASGSYVAMALKLCGLRPGSINTILLSWTIFSELSRHLGLFMFAFVMSTICLQETLK